MSEGCDVIVSKCRDAMSNGSRLSMLTIVLVVLTTLGVGGS